MIFLGLNRTIDPGCTPVHGLAEILSAVAPTVAGASGAELSQFHPRDGATTNEKQLAGKAGDLINKPASLFTGTMRLLLQDHYAKCVDTVVPYGFAFFKTHGIMLTSDGAPWVIEIDRTEGIRAIRLATGSLTQYATAPTDASAFRFEAKIEALPAHADNRWRLLADAPTVFGTLAGSPHYGEGWAFSLDGTKAAIVLIDAQPPYFYSRLFELTFTESDFTYSGPGGTDITIKVPASAALAVVEEDFFWQHPDGSDTRLKHPDGIGVIGVQIHSRDDLSGGTTVAPKDEFVCPVYCYYKGADLQVARWHHKTFVDTTSVTETRTLNAGVSTACYSTPGTPVVEASFKSGTEIIYRKGASFSGWARTTQVPTQNTFVAGNTRALSAYKDPYEWWRHTRNGVNDSTSVSDVLVLPILDREAMYHERALRVQESHSVIRAELRFWRADDVAADSYTGHRAPAASGVAGSVAIVNERPLATPFLFGGSHVTFYAAELEPAGKWFAYVNIAGANTLLTGDSHFEVAQQVATAAAASVGWASSATPNSVTADLEIHGIHRVEYNYNMVRVSDGSIVVQSAPGNLGFVQIYQSPPLWGPPVAFPPSAENSVGPAASTDDDTKVARLLGSVAAEQWNLTTAEHDAWQKQTGTLEKQEWIVAQDANSGGNVLYYDQPRPDGGTIGEVAKGSAAYSPGALISQLWAWIGKP